MARIYKFRDLTGQRFGSLVALEREWTRKGRNYVHFWDCVCDCGGHIRAQANHLTQGYRTSCGCRFSSLKTQAAFNAIKRHYYQHARQRGLSFELSDESLIRLFTDHCYYCGTAPDNVQRVMRRNRPIKYTYNGVDRVDNSKGYVIENVVSACYQCNHAKAGFSADDFLGWVKRVAEHQHFSS